MTGEEKVMEDLLEATAQLESKFVLFGIRDKETNRIVSIGFLGDKPVYGRTISIKGAKVWDSQATAEECFEILSQDEGFAKSCFVDKLTESEMNEYLGGMVGYGN